MRWATPIVAAVLLGGCMARIELDGGLQQAGRNYPPIIMGANTVPADGNPPYARSCPPPGSRVEQQGGPAFDYLGASPANPHLCRMRIGGQPAGVGYGIWLTDWPGADLAYPALTKIIRGRTGDVQGFDVSMQPGFEYHDVIRNEGIEDIKLLGQTYRALKISHYREWVGGNIYRSLSTVWKDTASGMLIYGTYQHISGAPVIDDPLIPTRIAPALSR